MRSFIRLFIIEYLSNHIINKIPSCKFRYVFYKYILKMDISNRAYIMLGQYIYADRIGKFVIDEYSTINRNCILDRRGGIYIGKNVNISAEVAIYTGGHKMNASDFGYYSKPVRIEDYVWIGTRAMIMPGITVGKGAMVMPGAVVVKDVAPFSIVGGVPAKYIGERSQDLNYKLTWRSLFL